MLQLKVCNVVFDLSKYYDVSFNCRNCPFSTCYDMETKIENAAMLAELDKAEQQVNELLAKQEIPGEEELDSLLYDLRKYGQDDSVKKVIVHLLKLYGNETAARHLCGAFVAHDCY